MMTSLIINLAQLKMTLKCSGHHWNLCCINRLKVVLDTEDGIHHHYQIEITVMWILITTTVNIEQRDQQGATISTVLHLFFSRPFSNQRNTKLDKTLTVNGKTILFSYNGQGPLTTFTGKFKNEIAVIALSLSGKCPGLVMIPI